MGGISLEDEGGPRDSFWHLIGRLLPLRRKALTEKELQEIIEESEQDGIIGEEEGEMLHSIFDFGDTIVRESMVPRTDMICCAEDAPLSEILEAIIDSGHSRIPVYEGSADHIVGIVYAKDLLRFWGRPESEVDVQRLMRTPYFVPETKNIEELLHEFRSKRVHMAIAIDEYGGTSGLITIEDLIEEIIGDIQDEYDLEEEMLIPQEDGSILVDGRLNIEELEEYFDIEIPREKFDTVGGYLFHLLGRIPETGNELRDGQLLLTVVESDPRKIGKVRVQRVEPESGESDSTS
ncbi:MAG: hemolysin family protein [Desulfuromonadales bacterium]